ncbi:PhzF family phenazine biosynthesis protein [soil metagenome]
MTTDLEYRHVDVFAEEPFTGNGLIVIFGATAGVSAATLRSVTVEMRQFESIFVDLAGDGTGVVARIFTAEEELPFAGHPVIGAAAALHERHAADDAERSWVFSIAGREIPVRSRRTALFYEAQMNQGTPELSRPLPGEQTGQFMRALGLGQEDLHSLPMQVISTGLPYLIVPLSRGLDRARISVSDLEDRLASVGAKFIYVLDPETREGRTWDNGGAVEDVATGSAAGPVAAYLTAHDLAQPGEAIQISQGRFVGRPSTIAVNTDALGEIWVGGPVAPVAHGTIGLGG